MDIPSSNTNMSYAANIFAEYEEFIHNVILYKMKDEANADDLHQDFFLSLASKLVPPNVQDIKSYLYRAVTNDVFDASRRMERYRTLVNKYAEHLDFSINKNHLGDASINGKETAKIFWLIWGKLSPTEAKAITLRYKDDCTIKETAEKMNVKKESVSRYICIGLKKLRQFFEAKKGRYDDRFKP